MEIEIYIEGQRLDIDKDISSLLTFAIDDIKDFSSRQTTFSKTIVLPGTSTNNKVFGHIFQPGQANAFDPAQDNVGYNFNAAKAADCIIFQDQLQTFTGILRLLQIDNMNGRLEYEVSVFGKLAGLNVALSGGLLEDIDFSTYDHVYNDTNIVASWDNPGGTGIYYPLIDYGTYSVNKHDWDIRTFRPAVYVYEIINKMFTAAGFRWSSDLFETPRFRSLVLPFNKKQLTIGLSILGEGSITSNKIFNFGLAGGSADVPFDLYTGSGFTANGSKTIFTYNGTETINVTLSFKFEGTFTGGGFFPSFSFFVLKNGVTIYFTYSIFSPFLIDLSLTISIAPGDTLKFNFGGTDVNITVTSASFKVKTDTVTQVPISIGDTVSLNNCIPKNIRQIDLLVSIVKMFNLYVYEDRLDANLIHLKPYITFYQNAHNSAVDWTYKLNRNKVVKTKPMSELNAKIYKFKFKPDSDYYNDLYKKRYNEGYGDRVYDSEFEFTDQVKEFEVIFSATPLVGYGGEDKVYSTIFKQSNGNEETVDSNIRILLSKKVTGVTSWQIKDGTTTLNTLTRYGYAGHLNDPDLPNDDLNFGVPRELFFTLVTGNLSNNQFNVYWSGYMREITDKDSKLLVGNFYLTAKDIIDLDFSKFVYLDGILFRLNLIKDYNASNPSDCLVELLKVNFTNYTEAADTEGPPDGNFLLWNDGNTLDFDDLPDNELLWTGGDSSIINWQLLVFIGGGSRSLKIFLNATLIVDVNTNGIGSIPAFAGDVIEVRVSATPSTRKKNLIVNSDVEGDLFNDVGTTTNKVFSWVVLSDRTYTVTGSITP